jgi:hypothetical protein
VLFLRYLLTPNIRIVPDAIVVAEYRNRHAFATNPIVPYALITRGAFDVSIEAKFTSENVEVSEALGSTVTVPIKP